MKGLFSFLLLITLNALGQSKEMINDLQSIGVKWNQGVLYLKNDEVLKGLIQFNDKIGALSVKTDDGSESYSANTVAKFEFFDDEVKVKRSFVSLKYPMDYLTDKNPPSFSLNENQSQNIKLLSTFFEVLKETNHFAVLSKIKPIEFKTKAYSNNASLNNTTYYNPIIKSKDEIRQNEVIYFLNSVGEVIPYLEILNSRQDKWNYVEIPFKKSSDEKAKQVGKTRSKKKTKNRILNSSLFETLMGESYPEVEKYIETNELSVDEKEDLFKIIDYYSSLQK